MQERIPERLKVSPSLVFYIIASMQIGIGFLGFQRFITKHAGQDAWISTIIAGLSLHIILWMIYKIAETVNGDLVTANTYLLGNIGGKLISTVFIVYYFIYVLTILRAYIEFIQVWMFSDISVFWFAFAFMLLCIYVVYGGFRTVVGMSFFGLILPFCLILVFSSNIKYAQFDHLLPIWNHSLKDILLGSYQMLLSFIGFETILFYYPFIKDPQRSKKWAHIAILTITLIFTGLMILTITFFSREQLLKATWPTLTMWKIVIFPFIERFEYIGIASWNLVILPNVCLSMWISSRLMKRIFNIRQKNGAILIALITVLVIKLVNSREKVSALNDIAIKIGFAFAFIYIPILFICIMIAKKVKKEE
ncbi:GerAB/ArcD/ProY family transporter [Bacillus sp. Bva_UNVM-123]|uniref:GerAB/ArcD/ProY family transporter n=1 Tax=Bacillus sp. Bva_UNVM-123 TaxID=2829798 RepID=UPI00391EEED8